MHEPPSHLNPLCISPNCNELEYLRGTALLFHIYSPQQHRRRAVLILSFSPQFFSTFDSIPPRPRFWCFQLAICLSQRLPRPSCGVQREKPPRQHRVKAAAKRRGKRWRNWWRRTLHWIRKLNAGYKHRAAPGVCDTVSPRETPASQLLWHSGAVQVLGDPC